MSSTTGDVWARSVNPNAPYSPLTLGPGQTGTITLAFTPNAPSGTVVNGFIGVDTQPGRPPLIGHGEPRPAKPFIPNDPW